MRTSEQFERSILRRCAQLADTATGKPPVEVLIRALCEELAEMNDRIDDVVEFVLNVGQGR